MNKVVLIPGNHNSKVDEIWFPYVIEQLEKNGIAVEAKNMPDPITAKKDIWLPFIESELKVDEDTIAVGHSSGAIALLRYAETHKVKGLILVGAYHTDLGDKTEKESGYFDDPWDWEAINQNTDFIVQFASTDDPYIPVEESRFIKSKLPKLEYIEFNDKGHMGEDIDMVEFPELVKIVTEKK
jgi:hypothetical protein